MCGAEWQVPSWVMTEALRRLGEVEEMRPLLAQDQERKRL
jgi:hypothetical protein